MTENFARDSEWSEVLRASLLKIRILWDVTSALFGE